MKARYFLGLAAAIFSALFSFVAWAHEKMRKNATNEKRRQLKCAD
jgi:hypothetical protein